MGYPWAGDENYLFKLARY